MKIVKLIRKNNEVINEETGIVVGEIKKGAVVFSATLNDRFEYDNDLKRYLEHEHKKQEDKFIAGTIEADLDDFLSIDEEIKEEEAKGLAHEEIEY